MLTLLSDGGTPKTFPFSPNINSLGFFAITVAFNTILYYFQVYSIVVTHLYNLQSDPLDKSSIHQALYIDMTVLLTVLPRLYSISL